MSPCRPPARPTTAGRLTPPRSPATRGPPPWSSVSNSCPPHRTTSSTTSGSASSPSTTKFAPPPAPAGLKVIGISELTKTRRALRLSWSPPTVTDAVHHYEIRRGGTGSTTRLGGTPNDVYYVAALDRNSETTTTITVFSVGPDGTRSTTGTSTDISWT
ncbi:GH85 family endohexosaminidase C-terminal domain-containing protein [Streptomyces carpaticus]|uniref:Endo-beta-N-acetylglucosaminidase D-like D2 domain-containing protein n=1 Tax=Streptomyces carpaticus TaxID=285558 RepID=A0ABV4ZNK9_9ACTN